MTVAEGAQIETPGTWPPAQLGPPGPRCAAWSRRVIASLLDGALGSGVAFLTLGAPASSLPFLGTWFSNSHYPGVATWTDSGWAIGTVLVAVAMQAYLGATPGKLVMGLAVVREVDARPVGLVRTVIRYVLHLVDAILFIGFLRPLWHAERRTFADSLASTLVLHTRRPRAHPWLSAPGSPSDAGPPLSWEAPTAPRWVPIGTTLAALVCAAGMLLSGQLGGSASAAGSMDLACLMTSTDPGPLGLTGGTVNADVYPATETRLGVTRRSTAARSPRVTWQLSATSDAPTSGTLRVEFTSADGTMTRSYDFPMPEGFGGTGTDSEALPVDTLDGFGTSWSWRQTVVVDGVESPACIGSISTG